MTKRSKKDVQKPGSSKGLADSMEAVDMETSQTDRLDNLTRRDEATSASATTVSGLNEEATSAVPMPAATTALSPSTIRALASSGEVSQVPNEPCISVHSTDSEKEETALEGSEGSTLEMTV